MSPNTCSNLMKLVAAIFGVYAILWSLAPFPDFNLPARFILDISDWPLDNLTTPLDKNTKWLVSIASGLLAALAVILAFIAAPAIKNGDKKTQRIIIYALVSWYIIDGIGSIAADVFSNVIFNSIYLAIALAPLLLVRPVSSK